MPFLKGNLGTMSLLSFFYHFPPPPNSVLKHEVLALSEVYYFVNYVYSFFCNFLKKLVYPSQRPPSPGASEPATLS